MANPMLGIPGPASRASTRKPRLLPSWMIHRVISPFRAYSTMLRATSEMAVAITVRSLPLNPACEANCRPSSLAVTMSAPERMGTRASLFTDAAPFGSFTEQGQALFEIQCGLHFSQREAQLHHGKGYLRLNPDDGGLGAAQA